MHYATIDRSTSTPAPAPRELRRYSPRVTLAILTGVSLTSWSLIILGIRAVI